ncbi:8-oxo-dGTP diphosphatase [Aequitasia blattaphilus]|uniref:8-oxo-dGTP diphosphatase n=1 Tax=Aequitasia blattaphilus TaxID=2949332 RepID=A0ABT1EC88_9FIRM|nr:8-oxo-dGTP diphosphatase MutT [Aequitasia blattaphilus]MCP1103439.1 8-oxo-dGTP diphosphatase MutT [Aequitasia blattaphilus]MCR8616079.1 8-oxo-dGTP diphosphatase MutT [Aequitasia blattaphilus]
MKSIEVVAAIIKKNGRIFATQRGYGEFKGGWEFPGGKIESGESAEDALVREIKEELETEVKVEELVHTVEYDYPQFHLTMHCYLCTIVEGELTLTEHEASRWLAKAEINSVDWLPADIEVVNILKNQYLNYE